MNTENASLYKHPPCSYNSLLVYSKLLRLLGYECWARCRDHRYSIVSIDGISSLSMSKKGVHIPSLVDLGYEFHNNALERYALNIMNSVP